MATLPRIAQEKVGGSTSDKALALVHFHALVLTPVLVGLVVLVVLAPALPPPVLDLVHLLALQGKRAITQRRRRSPALALVLVLALALALVPHEKSPGANKAQEALPTRTATSPSTTRTSRVSVVCPNTKGWTKTPRNKGRI